SPSMPGIWYQMGLHCTCPFNVEGFTFSGVPGVVIGHNARVAWGFTNLNPDVTDLYLEKVRGNDVLVGDTYVPLTVHQETIKVAGGAPATIAFGPSRPGPLVSARPPELLGGAAAGGVNAPGVAPPGSPRPTPALNAAAPDVPPAAAASDYAVALRW